MCGWLVGCAASRQLPHHHAAGPAEIRYSLHPVGKHTTCHTHHHPASSTHCTAPSQHPPTAHTLPPCRPIHTCSHANRLGGPAAPSTPHAAQAGPPIHTPLPPTHLQQLPPSGAQRVLRGYATPITHDPHTCSSSPQAGLSERCAVLVMRCAVWVF